MTKYLIALDLDGTLLTDEKVISPRTKQAITQLITEGHIVCIATGRPYRSSAMYYKELGLTTPIVNFNGAFVHHPQDDAWPIAHTTLPLEVVKEIIDATDSYTVHNMLAEVMDDVYFHYHDERMLDVFSLGNPETTIGDIRAMLKEDPTSLLIHAEEKDVETIRAYLSNVHANVIDHRRWGAPWHVIEIIAAGISKATGLTKIAAEYGISREHIIAFGDEDNDFEMIEFAGHGVAMGNAIDRLKEKATFVTATNNEDGIALYLEQIFPQLKVNA